MSSSDPVLQWERRWSQARLVRRTAPDGPAARRRLELAAVNLKRASRECAGGDLDAALIFAEQSLINSADAVLARDGFSAGSHVARFSYPRLPAIFATERADIDRIRSVRNTAQYDASGGVDAAHASRAINLAERAILAVSAMVTVDPV